MIDPTVETLILTLLRLRREKRSPLLSFWEIAREMEGSTLLAEMVQATVDLPEVAQYFLRQGSNRIGLSDVGLALAQELATKPRQRSEMEQIAAIVKRYAAKQKPQSLAIQSITPLAQTGRRHLHAIEVDLEESVVSNDTPVQIWRAETYGATNGIVVGQEPDDNRLYVALSQRLEAGDLPAKLTIERAFLTYKLAEAIAAQDVRPLRAEAIFRQEPHGVPIYDTDSAKVADMLALFRAPWTRFLWGPPGAGKTYALARFICQLLERKPDTRILLLAPSNQAVDTALAQLVAQLATSPARQLLTDYRVLRFGYPDRDEILQRPELLGSQAEQAKSQEIRRVSDRIRRLRENKGAEADIATERSRLLELQEDLKALTQAHVAQCQIVATTTTLAYMPSSPIHANRWNTVIVDEVTMVPPAMCVYLCGLADERMLFAGDPRQLGPVYSEDQYNNEEERRWLGQDIFAFAGLSQNQGEQRRITIEDRRLARITRQRRCAPPIWAKVEHLYEGVRCEVDLARIQHLPAFPPAKGQHFFLGDLSKYGDVRCQIKGSSWQNEFSANLAINIAIKISEEAQRSQRPVSVAIITPYRAQVKLLRSLRQARNDMLNLGQSTLDIGTIHQFQGSEADIVIFDLVDGPGRGKLGRLLEGDAGMRLVNVAVTRARGKVILLAHRQWFADAVTRKQNPLLWDILFKSSI